MEKSDSIENQSERPLCASYVGYALLAEQYYDCMSRTPNAVTTASPSTETGRPSSPRTGWKYERCRCAAPRTAKTSLGRRVPVRFDGPFGGDCHRFSQTSIIGRRTSGKQTYAVTESATRFHSAADDEKHDHHRRPEPSRNRRSKHPPAALRRTRPRSGGHSRGQPNPAISDPIGNLLCALSGR